MKRKAPPKPPPPPEEDGDKIPDSPRLWMRAVREGWQIPPMAKRAAVGRAASILADPSASRREIIRAAQVLALLERLAMDATEREDKMRRLDNGDKTEIVGFSMSPEQVAAVAKTLGGPE